MFDTYGLDARLRCLYSRSIRYPSIASWMCSPTCSPSPACAERSARGSRPASDWGWWATRHPGRRVPCRDVGHRVARVHAARSRASCCPATSSCSPRDRARDRRRRGDRRAHRRRATRAGTSRPAARVVRIGSGDDPHPHPLRALRIRPRGLDAGVRRCCRTSCTSAPSTAASSTTRSACSAASSPARSSRPRSSSTASSTSCSSSSCARGSSRARRAEPSWLGVLRDPIVGVAVAELHADPARAWTNARARPRGRGLPRDARAPLRHRARRDTGRLPDPLAHGPRRPPPARHRRPARSDRAVGRLHVGLRLQPRVQPRPLTPAGPLPRRRAVH